jgi:hypothetical protein
MSRHSARLRSLESKLAPAACPVCAGAPAVDFITLAPGETVPPRRACESCGAPHLVFVVELDTQQPAPVALGPNRAAETAREPRTRRRRYCGPE